LALHKNAVVMLLDFKFALFLLAFKKKLFKLNRISYFI